MALNLNRQDSWGCKTPFPAQKHLFIQPCKRKPCCVKGWHSRCKLCANKVLLPVCSIGPVICLDSTLLHVDRMSVAQTCSRQLPHSWDWTNPVGPMSRAAPDCLGKCVSACNQVYHFQKQLEACKAVSKQTFSNSNFSNQPHVWWGSWSSKHACSIHTPAGACLLQSIFCISWIKV